MSQASDRRDELRWRHSIWRGAAGILLTVGIFAMSFAVARVGTRPVNVILLTLGFVSLLSGVMLTRRLRPRRA
jgi:amino acid permease